MKPNPFSLKCLTLAALLCAAAAAQADVTVYTDRAAFLAALTAPGTDTFNDLAVTETPTPLSRSAGAYTYQVSSGPVADFYPAGSAADAWLATTVATDTITFSSFSAGLRAFGGNFFGSDIAGAFSPGRTMVLTASDGTSTRTVNLTNTTTSSFLGFITSNPLTSVTLSPDGVPGNVYWATANDVTMGIVSAVPEPETYGMLLAGLALVGYAARRRVG
ncbi:MAG: PEP-CTERM sorting domain-containing protein [Pseudomonadota bacterium]|nr:PEP-CTERM sorting domain-containing protein [Pseudomonadota bacterium]